MEQELSIPVNHDDFIHDLAYNFYGTRLATCGSDRCIKVWDWNKQTSLWILNESMTGHESSVVKLSWAHPEFGQVLASCSLDRSVRIWMEQESNLKNSSMRWRSVSTLNDSSCAVHSIAFAPEFRNLSLAAASSDGKVRFYSPVEPITLSNWTVSGHIDFIPGGASDSDGPLCLSWCKSRFTSPHMIAIGGSKGNRVKIFQLDTMQYSELHELDSYDAFVLDIDWAPSMGRSYHLIATACSDGHIRIYKFWSEPALARAALTDSLFIREGEDSDGEEPEPEPEPAAGGGERGEDDDDFDGDDSDNDLHDGSEDSEGSDDDETDDANTDSDSDDSDGSTSESGDDVHADEMGRAKGSSRRTRARETGDSSKLAVPRSELVADLVVDPHTPMRRVRWNSTGTLLVSSSDDGVARMWKMSVSGTWREIAAISAEKSSAENA
ncbi:epoxide hydrolase, soluble (sEH) [Coemansia erecta]|uniref:Epoxide hydrolase, soluble (SEH) n=1 Tax=Coemansia asiatica TaxID=1052880 RepID=A0A9W7XK25_9FUNG|nr:epoxide hydrolase, soluble (sEH) [Coemansia asiatica]KAJ2843928.1 epoxide hydrolase, soluble (sEH) [Coemansia erecta]